MTYLAIPISAQDLDRAQRQVRDAIRAGAESLELRMDYLDSLDANSVAALLAEVKTAGEGRIPAIVTCRDSKEGGAKPCPDELRMQVLRAAIEAGADFVDLEYANFVRPEIGRDIMAALAGHPKTRLILSAHDFTGKFSNLSRTYRDIARACPNAIPKLVYTARHINDCFEAFDLLHETRGDRIVLCMGEAGLISRVLAKKFGALATFASLDSQTATAPGQLAAGELKGLYRHDAIDAATELFGVIADPVGHSMSPAIHNACLADKGLNGLYLPLLVQGGQKEFDTFLDKILARPWLNFRGFSITIPHKHSALAYVRRKGGSIEPLAEKIGAMNTLVIGSRATGHGPQLSAYNTDYAGALDAITQGMDIERTGLSGMPVAVVGAGGVSRAIVAGLTDAGAKVTIYNRTVERAQELAADFTCQAAGLDELPRLDAKLVVNCTSIGMHPKVDATPVPAECLKPGMTVFDTVYNPAETLLLRQAKANGANTIDGITMFVNQAATQFHLFTGQPADTALMRKVVISSGLLVQHASAIADHRSWLRSFDKEYGAKWEKLLKNDPEAAICEAAVRELLESQGVKVDPQEDLSHGGPDYLCTRDHEHFYVEVTCISRDAASEATGLRDHPWGGPPDYKMMTRKIRGKVSSKANQCAGLNGPCLVAVCCLHSQAGGDACFDDCAAEEVLTSGPYLRWDYDAQTGDLVGESYEMTDLRDSSFVRRSRASHGFEYARNSVSGLLLCGLASRPWIVRGLLHPNSVRSFDRRMLPGIRFAKIVDGSLEKGCVEIEWI